MADDPLQQLKERTQRLTLNSAASSYVPPSSEELPTELPGKQNEEGDYLPEEVSSSPLSPPEGPSLAPEQQHKYHSELCLASFLLGILGLILPLFSVLAIVFGIAGFMQAHRNHLRGKWMAVVGLILGFLAIIALVIAIIFSWNLLEQYLARFGGIDSLIGEAQNAWG